MSKLKDISIEDFEAALDARQQVRAQQLTHIAISIGPVLFAGVVGYLHATTQPMPLPPGTIELLRVLSFTHIAVALGCWMAAFVIPALMLKPARLEAAMERPLVAPFGLGPAITDPREILLLAMSKAHLLRLALLEGPALFGLVICLLGAIRGGLHEHPVYWFNTGSTFVLVVVAALTFPTRDKLVEAFRRKKEDASIAF